MSALLNLEGLRTWSPLAPGQALQRLEQEIARTRRAPAVRRQAALLRARLASPPPAAGVGQTGGVVVLPGAGPAWLRSLVLDVQIGLADAFQRRVPARLGAALGHAADLLELPRAQLEGLPLTLALRPDPASLPDPCAVEGRSLDLAVLVALLSWLAGAAGPSALLSARVDDARTLAAVHGVEDKRAARLDRPDWPLRFGPGSPGADEREQLTADLPTALDRLLPDGWRAAARQGVRAPLVRQLREAHQLFLADRWEEAEQRYLTLRRQTEDSDQLDLHILACEHAGHAVGRRDAALGARRLQRAWGLRAAQLRHASPHRRVPLECQQALLDARAGSLQLSQMQHRAARLGLEAAATSLERLGPQAGLDDRTFAAALVGVHGTLARCLRASGGFERGVALQEAALERAPESERARTLGDLADLLRRAGRLDEARARLDEADAALGAMPAGYRHSSRRYHALHRARLALATGAPETARTIADDQLTDPGGLAPALAIGLLSARAAAGQLLGTTERARADVAAAVERADRPLFRWLALEAPLWLLSDNRPAHALGADVVPTLLGGLLFELDTLERARQTLLVRDDPDAARLLLLRCTH